MRRILGVFLSFLMTINIMILPVGAEDKPGKAETVMRGLGAFTENYEPDREVTRAEFAKVLCTLLHLSDPDYDSKMWKENVMTSNDGEKTIENGLFSDIDASHPYYTEVTLVGQYGIMNGVGDRLFAPEYGITVSEVSKVLLDSMSYGAAAAKDGGYPSGYSTLAYRLGMMKGTNVQPTSPVTESILIKMLYNSFDINLVEMSFGSKTEYTKSDDTFMTGVLQLGRIREYVTDNGFTALHGETELSAGRMKVGNMEVFSKNDRTDLSQYLGHWVELYYSENDGENYIEYVEIIDEDDSITFDAGDFQSYSNGVVSFYANNRSVKKRLASDAEMIVNNEWKQSFTAADFNFADGSITLIPDEKGNYGTVIVTRYEFAVVSGKDINSEVIYNKITNSASEKRYDFSGSDVSAKSIFTYDDSGNAIDFDAITTGSILNIVKSDKYMNVTVSGNIVADFNVSSISMEDDNPAIGNTETEYFLSGAFESVTNSIALENGHSYTLYLNMFGKVIWIEGAKTDSAFHTAVLTRAQFFENKRENESRCVSLYTDEGKLQNYAVGKTILLNGKKEKFDEAMSTLNQHKGDAVRYRLDETGNLAEIILASKINTNSCNNWYQIADSSMKYTFGTQGKDFSNQFYTDSSTLKFAIPNDEAYFGDEDYFSLNSVTFIDNKSDYKLSAFVSDKDDVVADAIVLKQDTASSAGTVKEAEAILIQNIKTTTNSYNDDVLRISGYAVGLTIGAPMFVEYDINDECKMVEFGETAVEVDKTKDETEVGPRTVNELSPGDIIYYETNIKNEITSARIAFDYSTGKAFDGGRGTNHYAPNTTGTAVNTTWVGKAISTYGNGIRLAIGCEPADVDYSNLENFRKQTSAYVIRRSDAVFIVEKGIHNKVNIQNGTINDIQTYNNTGNSCDNVVVLTYWSSGNYATVAYRY